MAREPPQSSTSQQWQDEQLSVPRISDHDSFAELMGKLSKYEHCLGLEDRLFD